MIKDNKFFVACLLVFFVVIVDQSLKFWVKLNMSYGDEISILGLPWALIHFVEGESFIEGLPFSGSNRLVLANLFVLLMTSLSLGYLLIVLEKNFSILRVVGFSLIVGGAIGNSIDRVLYGMIFSESVPYGELATFLPNGIDFKELCKGKVVNMLYFPIMSGYFPDWFPIVGGERYLIFKPVHSFSGLSVQLGLIIYCLSLRSIYDFIADSS